MPKQTGGVELYTAHVRIGYSKSAVLEENYNKTEVKEDAQSRNVIDIDLTASTLEKLQEKIKAHVDLAE